MKTPEQLADEYCMGGWTDFREHFLAGYAAAQTNFPTSGKWISVMTKTPPIENDGDETMLFLTIDKQLRMDVLFWDWMDWSNMNITHWMPLPKPPKENE